MIGYDSAASAVATERFLFEKYRHFLHEDASVLFEKRSYTRMKEAEETQIVSLRASGLKPNEIARRMKCHPQTVRNVLRRVKRRAAK